MGWTPTLLLAGAGLLVALLAGWRGARPPDLVKGPRLVPYRLIMVTAAVFVVLMLVHMANLAGVTTGRP